MTNGGLTEALLTVRQIGYSHAITDPQQAGIAMAKGDISTYNEDGVWKSKVEGSSRAAHAGGAKTEQQAIGPNMAQARGVEHTIRNLDGTIAEKNSYGSDPHPPKG